MVFVYIGTDDRGLERRGEIESPGLTEAAELLRSQGISPLSLEGAGPAPFETPLAEADAFVLFNRSLAEMTRLKIPLPRAVREIAKGVRRGRLKKSLDRIEQALKEGRKLHEAVEENSADFPPAYAWMIRAGEASGNLPAVLSAIAQNTETARRARRALAAALAYPVAVLAFGAILLSCFARYCLPEFHDFYRHSGLEPPFMVKGLLGASRTVTVPLAVFAGIPLAFAGLFAWMTRTAAGERVLFGLPLLGNILRLMALSRLLGTLEVLLRARTPLPDAVPVALGASGSVRLAREAETYRRRAAEGAGSAEVFRDCGLFPAEGVAYLALGERAGRLPEAASELAALQFEQALASIDSLYLILHPIAILVTGSFLATAFISLALAYAQLLQNVGY